jgi:hypothetical protein
VKSHCHRRVAGLAALWFLTTPVVHAAPIRTVSPSTGIFVGNVLLGRTEFIEKSGGGADVSALVVPAAGMYSPTTNTLFGIVVPYVEKRLDITGVGEGTARGLGDLTLIGHYRFLNRLGPGYADMAAVRLGLSLPTGSTDRHIGTLNVPEALRRALQPGAGSPALRFTLAAGREHYLYNLNVDGGYQLNTSDDDFSFGDQTFADLSVQTFILPAWTRARGFELLPALEVLFTHADKDHFGDGSVHDSGGNSLVIAPGIQWIATERVLFEASMGFPAIQDLNGGQPSLDHDVLVGFRFAF